MHIYTNHYSTYFAKLQHKFQYFLYQFSKSGSAAWICGAETDKEAQMKSQGILQGSAILMASVLFAKLCGALFRIPLTQLLGGTGMGYFSSAYGLFLPIFALSVTGMNTAVAALTAEAAVQSRWDEVRVIKSCALKLFGGIGIVGSLLLWCGAEPLCNHLLENPPATIAVRMLSPTVLICCLSAVLRGSREGLKQMTPTAISQAIEGVVRVVCGVALCWWALTADLSLLHISGDPISVAAAAAILGVTISAAAGLIYLLCCRPHLPQSAERIAVDRAAIRRKLLRILIPVAISSLVTNLTTLTDLFTAMRCLTDVIQRSPEVFGFTGTPSAKEAAETANFLYGAFSGLAVTVFNLVPSVTNMMGKSVLPAFAEAYTLGDRKAMERDAKTALYATAFLAIPAGLGIFTLAEPILTLLFPARTAEIAAAAPPLMILGIAVIFLALSHPIFSMLQAAGQADKTVWIMLLGIVFKIGGNLLLMRHAAIHLNGAAIATLLCYGVILLRAAAVLRSAAGIPLSMLRICGKPLFAGILCALTAKLTYSLLAVWGNALALLIGIGAGGVVYLLAIWCLTPDSKTHLKADGRRKSFS